MPHLSPDVVPGSLGLGTLEAGTEDAVNNQAYSLHEAGHARVDLFIKVEGSNQMPRNETHRRAKSALINGAQK
jgi:hypothetical protein